MMTAVIDASAVVSALIDGGHQGAWAGEFFSQANLASAHVMPAESLNALRRLVDRKVIHVDVAGRAASDLFALPIELFPIAPVGARVWELRRTLTAYDAWYVALAEELGAPLVTLDRKLARGPGLRCDFELPPSRS